MTYSTQAMWVKCSECVGIRRYIAACLFSFSSANHLSYRKHLLKYEKNNKTSRSFFVFIFVNSHIHGSYRKRLMPVYVFVCRRTSSWRAIQQLAERSSGSSRIHRQQFLCSRYTEQRMDSVHLYRIQKICLSKLVVSCSHVWNYTVWHINISTVNICFFWSSLNSVYFNSACLTWCDFFLILCLFCISTCMNYRYFRVVLAIS